MEVEVDQQDREDLDRGAEEASYDAEPLPSLGQDVRRNQPGDNPLLRLSDQMRTRSIFFNVLGVLLAALLIGPCGLLLWALLGRSMVHAGTIAVFIVSLPFAAVGLLFLGNVGYNLWIFYLRK